MFFTYFLLLAIFLSFIKNISSLTIYVDTNSSILSSLKPYGGSTKIEPGTIIQFKKGINKNSHWVNKLIGNKTHHIVIKGEQGVILEDGIAVEQSQYVDLVGPFEIRNLSKGSLWGGNGLTTSDCNHCLIENFYIHHCYKNCIHGGGSNLIVKNNIVHDCVYMNYGHNITGGGWGQALQIGIDHTDPLGLGLGYNNIAENNTVYNSWGEGIDLLYCDTCICRNNTIKNTFSVLVYTDNSRNLLIENNFLYSTTDEYNGSNKTKRPNGFGIGREEHGKVNATNITIRNNLVVNSQNGVMHIGREGYFSDIKILFNTFYNTSSFGLQFPGSKGPDQVLNNEVSNNLFSAGANFVKQTERESFISFANGWVNETGIWKIMTDTKGNSSFWIKKDMKIVLFPKANNCFRIECFLPKCLEEIPNNDEYGNLIINKGIPSENSNGLDFFGRKRDAEKPSLGFSELCTLPDEWINKNDKNKKQENEKGISTFFIVVLIILGVAIIILGLFFAYKLFFSKLLFKEKITLIDM